MVGGKRADGADRTDIDYVVVKLTSNGALDAGSGTNGLVTLDVRNGNDILRTAVIQPDGNIVVNDDIDGTNDVIMTVLFRLLPNGQFD